VRTYVRRVFRHQQRSRGPGPRSRPLLVVAACLATLAILGGAASPGQALAASCAGANAKPGEASRKANLRATLCELNVERRSHGLRPLLLNRTLSRAAVRHSRDMVRRQYFSHTTPAGFGLVQRIRRSGYLRSARHWIVGEDLAWGPGDWGSPGGIVRAWMNSPGHRAVILTPSFREVGIGLAWGAPQPFEEPAATYTSDFGVRLRRSWR
jgi:uncharacterized protein YkwD